MYIRSIAIFTLRQLLMLTMISWLLSLWQIKL
ncbi:hypothetical protein ACFX10_027715 [Malus domestica]